jgi:hypothetical protein
MIVDEYKKLTDVSTVSVGYPFRGVMTEVECTGTFVIQLKDVTLNQNINWSMCLETELTGKRKPEWIKEGDVLFSARGRNNHAVFVENMPNDMKVVASPHFFILRALNDEVLPEYLAWLLNQPPCQRHFKKKAEGTLTKSIRRGVIEGVPIIIPSLQKQKAIINIANTIKQEQQILKQLIHNGESTLNAIANDLYIQDFKFNARD